MSTDAGMTAPTAPMTTITTSLSSHPEFEYFVDIRAMGRQIARRFNDLDEVAAFVTDADAAARNAGFTVSISNDIPVDRPAHRKAN